MTHLILRECEQFLPKSISILNGPFFSQERLNLIPASEKSVSIPPDRIWSVSHFDYWRIPTHG